jgi:hypothetical protein
MLPRNVSQGSVKGNPKMHKENAPLRLIISGINHPTENIAEFAEEPWLTFRGSMYFFMSSVM